MPNKVKNSYKRNQVQANPEILPKVLEIVELIVGSKKGKASKDIYSITFETCDKIRSKKLGREYVDLITGCISNHRYKEAVKLLWMICLDKSISHIFIFKVAMIIFNNLEFDLKNEVISSFIRSIKHFKQLNKREILLEYAMYCLKNDMQNVEDTFQKISHLLKKTTVRKSYKIDSMLQAYVGFINYIYWCKNMDETEKYLSECFRVKAVFEYIKLFKSPGQWDVFILQLIEMMESSDQHDEIEDVLLNYVNVNPHDINGYIYLCVYLYYNNPDSENFIKHLEILADMCPSDPRILWLLEIWSKQGKEIKKCLRHIFMFLDYPSNGKNILAWKLLLQNLYQASINGDKKELKAIKRLWESRSSSWKWMYFNLSKIPQSDMCNSLLIAHRVVVISFFDTEHIFIKEMQKNFPSVADLVNSLQEEMPFSQNHLPC